MSQTLPRTKNLEPDSPNIALTWSFSCMSYKVSYMLHRIVPLWWLCDLSKHNFNEIVGFFITVKKITVFSFKRSRVRNNLAGCGGGLPHLTDCSHLCLPSCYRNDKSTRKPVQVTHNYLHFTSMSPDCDDVIEDQMGSSFRKQRLPTAHTDIIFQKVRRAQCI